MAKDFVPKGDSDLDSWILNFDDWVQEYGLEAGISPALIEESAARRALWEEKYGALAPALTVYQSIVTGKNEAGRGFVTLARGLVGQIQANPDTNDAQRIALKIPVRKTTRTAPSVPTTLPIFDITASRLRHSLHFRDEHTRQKRAKPHGVRGCQIWIFISPERALAATDAGDFRFVAEATKTPFHHDFSGEEVAQTAHYKLRWVNSRGETGPWSAVVSATIAA